MTAQINPNHPSGSKASRSGPGALLLSWLLAVACADLHPPPPAAQGGAGGAATSGSAGTGGGASSVAGTGTSGGGGGAGAGIGQVTNSSGTAATLGGSGGTSSAVAGDGQGSAGSTSAAEAGASGAGGEGGSAACHRVTSGDIHAWVFSEITAAATNEIHPFLALTTTGPDVALKRLVLRYYFSAEGSGDWQSECIWVTKPSGSGGGLCSEGVTTRIVSLEAPAPQADQYLEVSFAGVEGQMLSQVTLPILEARSRFWRAGRPTMNQSNDYSFVPTTDHEMTVEGKAYRETTKVSVYLDGALVWGEEPCP